MRTGILRLLATTCAIAIVGACSGADDGFSDEALVRDTATGSSSASDPDGDGGDQASRDDLSDEHAVDWTEFEQASPQVLRLHFVGGDTDCYGYRTEVRENHEAVAVRVLEGTLPEAPEVCSKIGLVGTILVELDEPLGNRNVEML
jgi:hypothetical protein